MTLTQMYMLVHQTFGTTALTTIVPEARTMTKIAMASTPINMVEDCNDTDASINPIMADMV